MGQSHESIQPQVMSRACNDILKLRKMLKEKADTPRFIILQLHNSVGDLLNAIPNLDENVRDAVLSFQTSWEIVTGVYDGGLCLNYTNPDSTFTAGVSVCASHEDNSVLIYMESARGREGVQLHDGNNTPPIVRNYVRMVINRNGNGIADVTFNPFLHREYGVKME